MPGMAHLYNLVNDREQIVAGPRLLERAQLVQDAPQGPDVAHVRVLLCLAHLR